MPRRTKIPPGSWPRRGSRRITSANNAFLAHGQLLRVIDRIRHLPGVIVQGRYDIICPPRSAWDLAQAWPEARLEMVLAGHGATEPAITDALIRATDAFADR